AQHPALVLEPRRHRDDHPVADRVEHLEAPVEQRTAATHSERLGPGGSKAFAAAGRGNDPDDGHAWMLYLAAAAAPSGSACDSSIRLSMYSSASPSSISRAYISSEARIFFARVNICFSPVERPLSASRRARFLTTSASSNTSPVLILSRLCLKRWFEFFGIWLTSSRSTDRTRATSSSPMTRRRPALPALAHGTMTVMSL